ncbi:MAG: sulfite exporter TauE/SafE family protein [Deltaproteobacteria bacterium]|nr:sulfite exporter TauE/SafE family protein [Deltaproteobacteria bacterium]
MAFDGVTVAVLLIIFVSTLVRAIFGFGHALIAMPLLALTPIGMKTATPLIALIAIILGLIIVRDWHIVDLRSIWRLLVATVPGIPLGLILLKGPYENTGKIILALIIIVFSCYALFRPRLIRLKQEWTAYPFGFLAGILGGAYNSNGPPIAIYGTLRRWRPDRFRTNLQGYFFPSSVIIVAGHGLGGLWTSEVG